MNLTDIGNFVAKSAPILASALTNPIGTGASLALSLIADKFGADKKNPLDILQKMQLDPESAIKLQELQNTHQEELEKVAATNYQTEIDDRKSARQREIALHDWVPTILAIGFLLNYAAIQFYCVIHNNTVNDIISARFQDVLIIIMSYYFGSSHKNLQNQK